MKIIIDDDIATYQVDFSRRDRIEDYEYIPYHPKVDEMYREFHHLMTLLYPESSIDAFLRDEYGKVTEFKDSSTAP